MSAVIAEAAPRNATFYRYFDDEDGNSLNSRWYPCNSPARPFVFDYQSRELAKPKALLGSRRPTLNQTGSHGSMMHYGCPTDIPIVHKLRDRTKRSDTARKHVLSRQTKIEKEDPGSPKPGQGCQGAHQQQVQQQNPFAASRRSSTISNASTSKLNKSRRASTISKTPSVDSRGAASTVEVNSPERSLLAMTTPRKAKDGQMAQTPSVERECRSQLSICSEPAPIRNLSCQSSLEPCVPEEDSPEQEDPPPPPRKISPAATSEVLPTAANRPDSLVLDGDGQSAANEKTNRFLYRSNSTKSFRKPKPKIKSKKLSNEFDQIYVISSGEHGGGQSGGGTGSRYPNFYHAKDDECYDSIEVIHERRSKNFSKFNSVCGGGDEPLEAELRSEPEVVGLGSNKFSVVADISPAMANLAGSQEKLLPEEAPLKSCAIDSAEQRLISGSTEDEDEDEGLAKTSGRHVADHNGSIQRYDTVIYNAAGAGAGGSSSVESEETPEADKEVDYCGLPPEGGPPGGDNGHDDGATSAGTGTKLSEKGEGVGGDDDDGNNIISRQSCV
ncbi:hypothetical protein quinque_002802 [Culex quinquefasciatus]